MKELYAIVLAIVVVCCVSVPILTAVIGTPTERKPVMSATDADREVHPIMNHDLILTLERSVEEREHHADLTIAADWLKITVQRLAPDELRAMAQFLNHYADRLEAR